MAVPTTVVLGGWRTSSFAAGPGVMEKAALLTAVKGVASAFRV